MQLPKINNPQLVKLLTTYWQWRMLWLATTAVFAGLGLFYVLFIKGDTWVASQAVIVRDEANGAVMRLGRFQSQTEMKAAQETILEMARNAQVLSDALKTVGRKPSWESWLFGEKPPTTAEIEDLARNGVAVRAPRGAELGTTEVIYIDVKQDSPERSLALNKAVCDALESRLQQVRQARADGVVAELLTTKKAAEEQLRQVTDQLTQIETETGADLSDLRSMTESASGGISNRTVLDTIKTELRQADLQLQQLKTDLQLAVDSYRNPDELLLTPSSLVNSQAGLKTLRDGLAAATINTSQMRGRYTDTHPLVQAALQSETNLREQLRNELGLSIQTLTKDSEIAAERVAKLNAQREQLETRLGKIANIRADYSNLVNEVRGRNQQLQDAERELAQAQASRDAALNSSLITRLDQPMIGEKPIGPGRSTILAGATISGLFFGLGIVFLLCPIDGGPSYGRRRFDYSGLAGRRAADKEARPVLEPTASVACPIATTDSQVPLRRAEDRREAQLPTAPEEIGQNVKIELPEWARPVQVTGKLSQIVQAWRMSQQPIKPNAKPMPTLPENEIAGATSTAMPMVAGANIVTQATRPVLQGDSMVASLAAEAALPPTSTKA